MERVCTERMRESPGATEEVGWMRGAAKEVPEPGNHKEYY